MRTIAQIYLDVKNGLYSNPNPGFQLDPKYLDENYDPFLHEEELPITESSGSYDFGTVLKAMSEVLIIMSSSGSEDEWVFGPLGPFSDTKDTDSILDLIANPDLEVAYGRYGNALTQETDLLRQLAMYDVKIFDAVSKAQGKLARMFGGVNNYRKFLADMVGQEKAKNLYDLTKLYRGDIKKNIRRVGADKIKKMYRNSVSPRDFFDAVKKWLMDQAQDLEAAPDNSSKEEKIAKLNKDLESQTKLKHKSNSVADGLEIKIQALERKLEEENSKVREAQRNIDRLEQIIRDTKNNIEKSSTNELVSLIKRGSFKAAITHHKKLMK